MSRSPKRESSAGVGDGTAGGAASPAAFGSGGGGGGGGGGAVNGGGGSAGGGGVEEGLRETSPARAKRPRPETPRDSPSTGRGSGTPAGGAAEGAAAAAGTKRPRPDTSGSGGARADDGGKTPVGAPPSVAAAAPAGGAPKAAGDGTGYGGRENIARQEEQDGLLSFRVIHNDGEPQNLMWLIGAKNIFAAQLPKMPREYIVRLVLDRKHRTLVAVKNNKVVGGVCFRPFQTQHFAEIAFCAITSSEQVKGYGTRLMNHLKEAVKKMDIRYFLTYADNYAIGYFEKQGFTKGTTMPSEQWAGYIKDYDGGTLMECLIHEGMDYLNIPTMISAQRLFITERIRAECSECLARVYPGVVGEPPSDVFELPGIREAGWRRTGTRHSARDAATLATNLAGFLRIVRLNVDAWPFEVVVEKIIQEAPDYPEVVKDPIDFTMIEKKVNEGVYKDWAGFTADLQLMLDNARSYNKPETQYYKCAERMDAFVKARLQTIT